MTDDNKNLFLAIGLSLLVIIALELFLRCAADQQGAADAASAADFGADAESGRAAQSCDGRFACCQSGRSQPRVRHSGECTRGDRDPRRGARRKPAYSHRNAEPDGLDRAQGRPDRRCFAQGLSRDAGPCEPEHRASLAFRSARRPIMPRSGFVGEAGAKAALPTSDTSMDRRRRPADPEKPLTLTYDNGQGLVFHRKISVDDQLHVHGRGQRRKQGNCTGHALSTIRSLRATASRRSPAMRFCSKACSASSATAACRKSTMMRSKRNPARRRC